MSFHSFLIPLETEGLYIQRVLSEMCPLISAHSLNLKGHFFFFFLPIIDNVVGLPWWLREENCNAGDLGLILGLGRSPGGGNGNPLQYSCLGNSIDREALGSQRVRYD